MALRVLVTGSRDFVDRDLARQAIVWAANVAGVENPADVTVVHGAARGADMVLAELAESFGCVVEAHPARWEELGKKAGPVRNQEMAALGADVCLAFPLPGSRGTLHCMQEAAKVGIPVVNCTGYQSS